MGSAVFFLGASNIMIYGKYICLFLFLSLHGSLLEIREEILCGVYTGLMWTHGTLIREVNPCDDPTRSVGVVLRGSTVH